MEILSTGCHREKKDRAHTPDAVSMSDNVTGHACFAVFEGHGGEKASVCTSQAVSADEACTASCTRVQQGGSCP